jgi:hypothetical protein
MSGYQYYEFIAVDRPLDDRSPAHFRVPIREWASAAEGPDCPGCSVWDGCGGAGDLYAAIVGGHSDEQSAGAAHVLALQHGDLPGPLPPAPTVHLATHPNRTPTTATRLVLEHFHTVWPPVS